VFCADCCAGSRFSVTASSVTLVCQCAGLTTQPLHPRQVSPPPHYNSKWTPWTDSSTEESLSDRARFRGTASQQTGLPPESLWDNQRYRNAWAERDGWCIQHPGIMTPMMTMMTTTTTAMIRRFADGFELLKFFIIRNLAVAREGWPYAGVGRPAKDFRVMWKRLVLNRNLGTILHRLATIHHNTFVTDGQTDGQTTTRNSLTVGPKAWRPRLIWKEKSITVSPSVFSLLTFFLLLPLSHSFWFFLSFFCFLVFPFYSNRPESLGSSCCIILHGWFKDPNVYTKHYLLKIKIDIHKDKYVN